jgi:leader peptidase (prepilin peptidase)/N-methyltransferase
MIAWYDNIPLFSYLVLKGKCRNCGKNISIRYFLIEAATGIIFILLYFFTEGCLSISDEPICTLYREFGNMSLPYLFIITFNLITIFVIDFEERIIPDGLIFLNFAVILIFFLFFSVNTLFLNLGTAFAASFFLLAINLITSGRGMGLGDVKLTLSLGLFFGWPYTLIWLYTSILMGAFVGLILIFFKKASFGRQIAFGPFLVTSFFITIFWGDFLNKILFFYLV